MDYAAALQSGGGPGSANSRTIATTTKTSLAQRPRPPPSTTPDAPSRASKGHPASKNHQQQFPTAPTNGNNPRRSSRSPPPPKPEHLPNTPNPESAVYVLTLTLTPSLSTPLNALRNEHFPKALNHIPAHITLFHALPGSHLSSIQADIATLTARNRPFPVTTGTPFRMRRGVGVRMNGGLHEARGLREKMSRLWEKWLSEQDAETKWRPHWTVMNKVDKQGVVEMAFEEVCEMLRVPVVGKAVGVTLWRYLPSGRWAEVKEYEFELGKEGVVIGDEDGESGRF